MVPFLDVGVSWRALDEELSEAINRVASSGYYIGGPELEKFENEYAAYCEANYAVGTGNGLDALRLSLDSFGISPGDEVIVPSHTYIASWLAVSYTGAVPVPVEPSAGLFTIDPARIEEKITPKTKAIMVVHLYGQPVDLDPILELAKRYNLFLLEDAAQSQGARYKGKRIGAHGDAVAWSFYPGKNLGALGDAGAVTTDDSKLAREIRMRGNYGSEIKYDHQFKGVNSRLDPLQAAVLAVKLKVLDEWNARRRGIAKRYTEALSDLPLQCPLTPEWAEPVWHLYVVRSKDRDALATHLAAENIQTVLHYPKACFDQPAYAEYRPAGNEWPMARTIASEVLSLPIGPHLSEAETERVVNAVRGFYRA